MTLEQQLEQAQAELKAAHEATKRAYESIAEWQKRSFDFKVELCGALGWMDRHGAAVSRATVVSDKRIIDQVKWLCEQNEKKTDAPKEPTP